MSLCSYNSPEAVKREKDINTVRAHWNKFKNLKEGIGEAGTDVLAEESIQIMAENLFQGKSLSMDVSLSPGEVRRLNTEITKLNKRYEKNRMGSLYLNTAVGESISIKHPLARSFYESVNEAYNFERNYQDNSFYKIKNVSEQLLDAMAATGSKGFRANLRKAQAEYFKASANDNKSQAEAAMVEVKKEIESLVASDNGKVYRDFQDLIEMNKTDFGTRSKIAPYDIRVRNAAESARALLDKLGKEVALPGLDNLMEVATRASHNGTTPKLMDKHLYRFQEKINAAKNRIKDNLEAGGYYPHIMLEDLVQINEALQNKLLTAKGGAQVKAALEGDGGVISMIDAMVPDRIKAETSLSDKFWNHDPIEVLNQYARDIIAFNKINWIGAKYLEVMPAFSSPKFSENYINGMRQFLDDTFRVSTRGFRDRPEWVNNMSRTLLSAWTLKTMGLSTTGATRNFLSAAYFFGGVGMRKTVKALGAYKNKKHIGGDAETITDIVNKVEEEQGFHFKQAETFNEMVADGLVSASADKGSIMFDPSSNKIVYKDQGAWRAIDDGIRWATTKSLVLHRLGENITRTALFRSAFIQSYEVLSKTDMPKLERTLRAKRFALRSVNQFAFEYAPHSKARMVGGRAASGKIDPVTGKPKMTGLDAAAAGGQLMFQFMHFPMSFMQNQARILKGGIDAVRSRQIDAPEYAIAMNFAGIALATQALSIFFNADLNNILENDTFERFKELAEHLTDDPDVEGKKRGIVSLASGPILSDLIWWTSTNLMNEAPEGEMYEMLLGDIDYDDPVVETNSRRYRLASEWGRWANKILPEVGNGHGWDAMWRHIFAAYPRDWTRSMNRKVSRWLDDKVASPLGYHDLYKPATFKRKSNKRSKTLRKLAQLSGDISQGRL